MRVGTLTFATSQGLGILAKSFYDHGIITDVMIVLHSSRETHEEWYPNHKGFCPGRCWKREGKIVTSFVSKMDAMVFFETPFHWELLNYCRQQGIKTCLMPMYECMPRQLPSLPDEYWCPSLLDQQYFPLDSKYLPVPVCVDPKCSCLFKVKHKLREKALHFVHNAGHLGLKSRNGTGELLDALPYIESPVKFTIRAQKAPPWNVQDRLKSLKNNVKVDFSLGTVPYESLYDEGDVFVFPEKFNGLSLPLQEACASGMVVMCGDRFPMNTWLPKEPLIPIESYSKNCVSPRCLMFDEAQISPKAIAARIDEYYGKDISCLSLRGLEWAKANSWEYLKPLYLKELAS